MNSIELHEPSETERKSALRELFATSKRSDAFRMSAAADLSEVAPTLEKILRLSYDTGQGTKVRTILWSLYSGSGLVQLGYQCSSLDTEIAEALAVAIRARLALGADAEDALRGILERGGEFVRYEDAAQRTPESFPVVYPLPPVTPAHLRAIADSIEEVSKIESEE